MIHPNGGCLGFFHQQYVSFQEGIFFVTWKFCFLNAQKKPENKASSNLSIYLYKALKTHIFLPTTHTWTQQGFVSWTALLPRWTTLPEQLGQVELSNLSSKSLYLDRMTISISGLNMIVNQRVYISIIFLENPCGKCIAYIILYKHMYCIEIHQIRFKKKTYLSSMVQIRTSAVRRISINPGCWLMCLGARFCDDPLVIGILKSPMQWDSQFTRYFALMGFFRYISYITFKG